MELYEKEISKEYVYEGSIIKVRHDEVLLPDGQKAGRDVVEHPGGVCVLAIDDNDEVLMVRQYRRPIDDITYEIPAGKLDRGEEHLSAGKRELEEETGYRAKNFRYLGGYYVTPGFCNEMIHIYLATELERGKINPDEDEFIEPAREKFDSLLQKVMRGEINDGKTALAITIAAAIRG